MIEFTDEADAGIERIKYIGIRDFGIVVAERFKKSLLKKLELLAEFPGIGRDYGFLQPGMRRAEHPPYSIYYRETARGIFILRVLHQRQDPFRHFSSPPS